MGTKDPKTKDPIYKGPKVTKDPKLHRTQNKVYYKGPKITKDPIYKRPKITKDPIYNRPNVIKNTKDPKNIFFLIHLFNKKIHHISHVSNQM